LNNKELLYFMFKCMPFIVFNQHIQIDSTLCSYPFFPFDSQWKSTKMSDTLCILNILYIIEFEDWVHLYFWTNCLKQSSHRNELFKCLVLLNVCKKLELEPKHIFYFNSSKSLFNSERNVKFKTFELFKLNLCTNKRMRE
jgi:hypothetical protein